LAKIAVELERALARRDADGTPGGATPRLIARGNGWTVADVVCTSGPQDVPFEERHARYSIAVVVAGSFQYRSSRGSGLMTPGSLMLGNAGQCYECGHQHGRGDRCVSFWYAPEYFERLAAGSGTRRLDFQAARLPPQRALAPLVGRAAAGAAGFGGGSWEELGVRLAACACRFASESTPVGNAPPPNAVARVTRAARAIERHPDAALTLASLARHAGLSPYHFLRTFERVTGTTPHQYILRARLREAALRLADAPSHVLDVALDCGFGDVSNFNRAFRAEFGVNPSSYRAEPGAVVGKSPPRKHENTKTAKAR
jgi:AraC family transcriptional regulator